MCRKCCCESNCKTYVHDHGRRFLTKTEKIEKLKNYAEELKNEIAVIDMCIQELNE